MKPTALDMCLTGVPAEQLVHSEERGDHRCDPANHAQKKRTAPRCVTAGKSDLQYSGTKCAKMRFTLSNGVTPERKKKMSKFKDDLKLLGELQSLIDEAKKRPILLTTPRMFSGLSLRCSRK